MRRSSAWMLALAFVFACTEERQPSAERDATTGDAAPREDAAATPDARAEDTGGGDATAMDAIARDADSPPEDASNPDAAPDDASSPDARADAGNGDGSVPDTGVPGCVAGSCTAGQVCHLDGLCGALCADDTACTARFGPDTYCNTLPSRPPPRPYKPYRDNSSCAPLGCEGPNECVAAGTVCDTSQSPPSCVPGCLSDNDCPAAQSCRDGPAGSYTVEQCRMLSPIGASGRIGVCCNPGCTNRVLQCSIGDFCCGELDSPYEVESMCLPLLAGGSGMALGGECFEAPLDPFCHECMSDGDCNSGWTAGYNVDPTINGGLPFQEQEWCVQIGPSTSVCSVTCHPTAADNGCPRGWNCRPYYPPCLQDSDCNGLACQGENTSVSPPIPGRCSCGSGGVPAAACPTAYQLLSSAVANPRCIDGGSGDMFCAASYDCQPPANLASYPAACGL